MHTEREKAAELVAQHGYRKAFDELSDEAKVSCLKIADQILADEAREQYEADREAAKTWGGDIDLVSFEGE